ncbi:MAG: zinc metallopeptidase [Solirubrobacterales bacterium]|nr:zinc metallopeptidase [Solirubrobacterales bacterium]
MKWKRVSNPDVIDTRGRRGGMPGGRVALPGGVGLVGVLVFLAIQLLGGGGGGSAFDVPIGLDGGARPPAADPIPASQDPERDLKDFSTYVFTDTVSSWQATFQRSGKSFDRPKMVLFRDGVQTGCGAASSAVGPFYCPADQRVYLDLSFEDELQQKLGAGGDFAWAYVIAHEVGHHVQTQTGASQRVEQLRREDPGSANELSVRLELQADCYAGVWAHGVFARGDLESGDVQEAMTAAEAVGDDRLQRRAGGQVDPDTFTHGTSAQRQKWFDAGYEGGDPGACDTFAADQL